MTASPGPLSPRLILAVLTVAVAIAGCSRNTEPQAVAPVAMPDGPRAEPPTASIRVSVRLSPALRAQTTPDDVVYIFARATQGPKMPLAIVRKRVKDLPLTVTLDDSTAMVPDFKLSGFSEVVVGARVSKSGDAVAQPGDLEGLSAPVQTGSRTEVVIASVVGAAKTESAASAPHGGKTRLAIPADVKAKWKSAELSLAGQDIVLRTVKVAIGGEIDLGKDLVLRVLAYVPAFQSDAGTVTSASNNPDNPAVLVQLLDRKQPVAEGWVFQKLPDFNTFATDRLKVQLLGASG